MIHVLKKAFKPNLTVLLWLIVGCILEKIENQFAVIASTDRAASSQAIMSGDENEWTLGVETRCGQ